RGNRYLNIGRGFNSINRNSIVGGGYPRRENLIKEGNSVFKFGRGNYFSSEEEEKIIGFLR
ncbi:hypothetical protein OFB58_27645, partial [Escherichia coli]|nr:hypothetical protein [Escherichia coli]